MNKEDLLNRAREQAKKAPEEYKTSIELYYITRYFVSVFEARNHAIPIQVWNEYRNALDHFFRHITSDDYPEITENLRRMEGHMKRAALDIMKINCHKSDEWINEEISKYHTSAQLFIDNGNFIESFQKQRAVAKSIFLQAKAEDYNFGLDSSTNKKILTLYIDAAIAYEELMEFIKSRTSDLLKAQIRYQEITGTSENNARRNNLFQNLFVGLIVGAIFFAAGYYFK